MLDFWQNRTRNKRHTFISCDVDKKHLKQYTKHIKDPLTILFKETRVHMTISVPHKIYWYLNIQSASELLHQLQELAGGPHKAEIKALDLLAVWAWIRSDINWKTIYYQIMISNGSKSILRWNPDQMNAAELKKSHDPWI